MDFIIPTSVQIERDRKSLELLLQERASGSPSNLLIPVNAAKNLDKERWVPASIDEEIKKRKFVLEELLKRKAAEPQETILRDSVSEYFKLRNLTK